MRTVFELLVEYWKAGCQCRLDTVELCPLCQETFKVLKAHGVFNEQDEPFNAKSKGEKS